MRPGHKVPRKGLNADHGGLAPGRRFNEAGAQSTPEGWRKERRAQPERPASMRPGHKVPRKAVMAPCANLAQKSASMRPGHKVPRKGRGRANAVQARGVASMRPGHKVPRKVPRARWGLCAPLRFNEAGAQSTPEDSASNAEASRCSGFNEAGAQSTPEGAPDGDGLPQHLYASMRPGHKVPRKDPLRGGRRRPADSFNEAGAQSTPEGRVDLLASVRTVDASMRPGHKVPRKALLGCVVIEDASRLQ